MMNATSPLLEKESCSERTSPCIHRQAMRSLTSFNLLQRDDLLDYSMLKCAYTEQ
jgi:hypothetical protein